MSARMNPLKSLSEVLRVSRFAALAGLTLLGTNVANAQAQVSQTPLSAGRTVPGNLFLVPSVEWPTLDSMANIEATYTTTRAFPGYFDPEKCYRYNYSTTETERFFTPTRAATSRTCTPSNLEWSGNFLNWAATQTIDPFRKALTGGYRVQDTAARTLLEKARSDSNTTDSIYGDRNLGNATLVAGAIPADWASASTRVRTFGNKMRFRGPGTADLTSTTPTAYNPGSHSLNAASNNTVFEVSVRVLVCDPAFLEANCVRYSATSYKPEGLIQEYSRRIRFSAFGFLNDHADLRDGGVLRARQKFVGPQKLDVATQLWVDNDAKEWDATTGILVKNPDDEDAAVTAGVVGTTSAPGLTSYNTGTAAAPLGTTTPVAKTVNDSGVINYINRFGQMTAKTHKSRDPVSELYYTALRYMRGMTNISAYSTLAGTANARYELADGFPVITDWNGPSDNEDPIQYRCQKNAFLGIGDTNSHKDKNLPGHRAHSSYTTNDTNAEPADAAAPNTIDVYVATQKVATNEGITIPTNSEFTGRQNSAYIAGLAYHAHTKDMRPDLEGTQTVSTHWVDVRENQILQPRARNQYWLAAKYGGFDLALSETTPASNPFNPYAATVTIPQDAWTDGDTLENGDLRPRNFYVASDADKMIASLTDAFRNIAQENLGSSASLAANSTRLDINTRTFQAQFRSGKWTGELNSYIVTPVTGALQLPPDWSASLHSTLDAANWAARNIKVPTGASTQADFLWTNLTATQRTALGSANMVDYLRGDATNEQTATGGIYRPRESILGDIVNSTPVYVGKPNASLYSGVTFAGSGTYGAFAAARAGRTGMVYVGANDGMLHAFDASNGAERYAFIPNTVIMNSLTAIADPAYTHRYYVDGDMAIADAYDGTNWKTILVGSLGRGGPGVFALDITDPSSIRFLWERSGADIDSLGKNIGRPVIAQVGDGDWRVLIGNGPESTDDTAALITIDVFTGAFTEIPAAESPATPAVGNGLSAVLGRDTDGDGFTDTAYGGDMLGNLWKFTSIAGAGSVRRLFTATDPTNPQPITAAPLVGRDPVTAALWVFFGTGSYLSDDDFISTQRQTWYGIKDTNTAVTRAQLLSRDIETTVPYSLGPLINDPADDVLGKRTIVEGTAADLATYRGWYIDFDDTPRERMVVPNRFQGGALVGTTRIPDPTDACDPSGSGFIMAINPFTGARLDQTFFDTNGDGLFNNSDLLGGEIISGIGFNSSPNSPIFVEDVMQVSLDDGSTKTIRTQGSSVAAERLNWREVIN
jgi:type IV pilus assembly protein PilY1